MKKIIAHRGAPSLAHENTMESFFRACELGADYIEFDIRRTKDGILVAHHDPFIVHDSEKINLRDLKFQQLADIALSQNFQVPEIKKILQIFAGKVGLDIELKEENCEQEVVQMIWDLPVKPNFFFTSFNAGILKKIKNIDHSLQTGLLFESMELINSENLEGIDFLCPDFCTFFSNRDFFSNNVSVRSFSAVWTVNTRENIERVLKDPFIGAVITNETSLAVSIRNELSCKTV